MLLLAGRQESWCCASLWPPWAFVAKLSLPGSPKLHQLLASLGLC